MFSNHCLSFPWVLHVYFFILSVERFLDPYWVHFVIEQLLKWMPTLVRSLYFSVKWKSMLLYGFRWKRSRSGSKLIELSLYVINLYREDFFQPVWLVLYLFQKLCSHILSSENSRSRSSISRSKWSIGVWSNWDNREVSISNVYGYGYVYV